VIGLKARPDAEDAHGEVLRLGLLVAKEASESSGSRAAFCIDIYRLGGNSGPETG
jgi:hypothetical protein